MSKSRLILVAMLTVAAAACGQLSQGKQQTPATGAESESAAPAAAGSTDDKPAEAAGSDAAKPEADKPS